jgi:hypothetical protein
VAMDEADLPGGVSVADELSARIRKSRAFATCVGARGNQRGQEYQGEYEAQGHADRDPAAIARRLFRPGRNRPADKRRQRSGLMLRRDRGLRHGLDDTGLPVSFQPVVGGHTASPFRLGFSSPAVQGVDSELTHVRRTRP